MHSLLGETPEQKQKKSLERNYRKYTWQTQRYFSIKIASVIYIQNRRKWW